MSETVQKYQNIPGISIFTMKLIEALKEGKIGDTFTDEALYEICGRNTACDQPGYGNLQTAIRHCVRNHGIVWRRVRDANQIKCLSNCERIEVGEIERRRIHKRAQRATKIMQTVDTSKLGNDDRIRFNITAAQLGMLAMLASKGAATKLSVRDISTPIDMKKMLAALG